MVPNKEIVAEMASHCPLVLEEQHRAAATGAESGKDCFAAKEQESEETAAQKLKEEEFAAVELMNKEKAAELAFWLGVVRINTVFVVCVHRATGVAVVG